MAALTRLSLVTLADLVTHYPRRHEDRRTFDRFPNGEMEHAVCLCGTVTKTALKRIGGWRKMFEVTLEEANGGILSQPIICRWFNMPYIHKLIVTGQDMVVYGKPKQRGRQVVIDHPEFESIEEDEESSIHMQRITPVHPAGDGVNVRLLRSLIHRALEECDLAQMAGLLDEKNAPPIGPALKTIHFPEQLTDLPSARERLVREEFFGIQLLLGARRAQWTELPGIAKDTSGELMEKFHAALPFALTESQKEVIQQIRADLISKRRMNRLLQGDVGSGKTVVALSALLLAVEAGWQGAIMAPTQILAEQHYLNFQRLLEPFGINVALRTGTRSEQNTPLPLFSGGKTSSSAQIIVGTHALLYSGAEFDRLGLVVIDEQHKFGVLQRAKLIERGDAPDVLVMTATPIPRTLTQTLYGDLDVSILREKPANRGKILTAVREPGKLPEIIDFLLKQLAEGRQAYIVYPLVEESEKLEAKSAVAEFEKWKPLLAPHRVGLIHGRLTPEAKDEVMKQFRDGALSAIVSTTVIEVGVDVPNANFMLLENAERFGLSQMHQLRGRIGRGAHKSYCVLLHDPKAPEEAKEKLAVLEQTTDGFEIAEADMRLRGPGDLLGTAQTGLPPLKLGNLLRDGEIMTTTRQMAQAIFEKDPHLLMPAHARMKDYIITHQTLLPATEG